MGQQHGCSQPHCCHVPSWTITEEARLLFHQRSMIESSESHDYPRKASDWFYLSHVTIPDWIPVGRMMEYYNLDTWTKPHGQPLWDHHEGRGVTERNQKKRQETMLSRKRTCYSSPHPQYPFRSPCVHRLNAPLLSTLPGKKNTSSFEKASQSLLKM